MAPSVYGTSGSLQMSWMLVDTPWSGTFEETYVRRIATWLTCAALVLPACGTPPLTQASAEASVMSAPAANAQTGIYHVGKVEVSVVKVVPLTDGFMGMRFRITSPLHDRNATYEIFPRVALGTPTVVGDAGETEFTLVEPTSDITPGHTMGFRLVRTDPLERLDGFTVDFDAIGVTFPVSSG